MDQALRPDVAAKTPRWADVYSVGPGVPDFNNVLVPVPLEEDQLVYTMAHGQESVDFSSLVGLVDGLPEGDIKVLSVHDIMCYMVDQEQKLIQPLGQLVEIERIEIQKTSEAGLLLPDSQLVPPNLAFVKTVGIGWHTPNGDPIDFHVKPGDVISYIGLRSMLIEFNDLGINHRTRVVGHGDITNVWQLSDEVKAELRKRVMKE